MPYKRIEKPPRIVDERISDLIIGKSIRQMMQTQFTIIKFSNYCDVEEEEWNQTGNVHYIPAEVGLCVFSCAGGIHDMYSTLIDPVFVPTGLKATAQAKAFGIPEPGYDDFQCKDVNKIFGQIELFIRRYANEWKGKFVVLSRDKDIKETLGCLAWFKEKGLGDFNIEIEVAPLEFLLLYIAVIGRENMEIQLAYTLNDTLLATPTSYGEIAEEYRRFYKLNPAVIGIVTGTEKLKKGEIPIAFGRFDKPNISLEEWKYQSILVSFYHVEEFFDKMKYMEYNPGLPCLHHAVNQTTGSSKCPLYLVQTLAYGTLDALSKHNPITLEEGAHFAIADKKAAVRRTRLILGAWGVHGFDVSNKFISSRATKIKIANVEDWNKYFEK